MKIAIQGFTGSFHAMAAQKYFGSGHELVMCDSFFNLFKALRIGEADAAVMAIENTIAGTILFNYTLLKESNCYIGGETYLRIEHALLALPGQTIADIKEVRSHPMALMQCMRFFANHAHIKLVEDKDTALMAEQIAQRQSIGIAAIADKSVAPLFGLEVLQQNIEDSAHNYTRFLILNKDKDHRMQGQFNKATLSFSLTHEIGSLSHVLKVFSDHKLNLATIQSTPYVGNAWEYFFHTDIEFEDMTTFEAAIHKVRQYTTSFRILGMYNKGIE